MAESKVIALDRVITTDELARRPSRPADYESESRAIAGILEALAKATEIEDADRVLQQLVKTALRLCRAHSAGVSILEVADGEEVFRWRAVAGQWEKFLGGSMPRASSPCGTVLQLDRPILMSHPERHYLYDAEALPIAEALLIPFHWEGKPVGTVWILAHDETRRFDAEDLRIVKSLSRSAATAYQLLASQAIKSQLAAQRELDRRLAADLSDSKLLQRISAELIQHGNVDALYDQILEAAVAIMRSDFASMQVVREHDGNELLLLGARGFTPEASAFWSRVPVHSTTTCGKALRSKARIVIPDVEACPDFAPQQVEMYARTGIRAIQSTPLVSRTGSVVGMISTHWRTPHEPSERDTRLFDILARQAADLVERRRAEDELKEAHRRKDEFLATLAHELRNPLAPVRNAVEILKLKGSTNEEARWAQDLIDRQIRQMTRLIDDLLDVSRIQRDRMELRREPVDLERIVQIAVETSRPFVEECGQDLTVMLPSEPVRVHADVARMAQVFSNLLNNAAKYTDRGGHIHVTAERDGKNVLVAVSDDGIGIASELLSRIFEPFTQVDRSLERTRGGLGIGLTLVKRLVEMHGGTVAAESDGAGKGSRFSVRLPIHDGPPAEEPPVAEVAPASALSRRRVLIVDDNLDASASLGMVLRALGYETIAANDGIAGYEAASDFRPDVALLDLGMPRLNGYDLAKRIRGEDWGKEMLLIALTGWGQAQDKARSVAAGFDHHLVKPIAPTELVRWLAASGTRT